MNQPCIEYLEVKMSVIFHIGKQVQITLKIQGRLFCFVFCFEHLQLDCTFSLRFCVNFPFLLVICTIIDLMKKKLL